MSGVRSSLPERYTDNQERIWKGSTWCTIKSAKDRAVLKYLLDGKMSLLSPCRNGRERFEMEANKLLPICSWAALLPPGSKAPNPRKCRKNRCAASFIAYTGREIGGLWLCQCVQPNYVVVSGRAFFSTKFAPGKASDEIKTLRKCSTSTSAQLKKVCINTPGDIELLALQIFRNDGSQCSRQGVVRGRVLWSGGRGSQLFY